MIHSCVTAASLACCTAMIGSASVDHLSWSEVASLQGAQCYSELVKRVPLRCQQPLLSRALKASVCLSLPRFDRLNRASSCVLCRLRSASLVSTAAESCVPSQLELCIAGCFSVDSAFALALVVRSSVPLLYDDVGVCLATLIPPASTSSFGFTSSSWRGCKNSEAPIASVASALAPPTRDRPLPPPSPVNRLHDDQHTPRPRFRLSVSLSPESAFPLPARTPESRRVSSATATNQHSQSRMSRVLSLKSVTHTQPQYTRYCLHPDPPTLLLRLTDYNCTYRHPPFTPHLSFRTPPCYPSIPLDSSLSAVLSANPLPERLVLIVYRKHSSTLQSSETSPLRKAHHS